MAIVDTTKVAGFFGDFKTIWVGVALLIAGAAWAGDTRWMQKADGAMIAVQIKLDALEDDIGELIIDKSLNVGSPKAVERIDAMIEYKENKRDALVKKHSIK
ncbi:hypothetical protein KAR91_08040 [Candidatus Pacearchaeota archaeon]|nr:hypothetical protein [Candidatus Pacearchaeota archaeon]